MGFGDVGGDGSVKWVFEGDRIRSGSPKSDPKPGKGHHQEAVDETDAGEKFTITIRLPRDPQQRDAFLSELSSAGAKAAGGKVTFTLPIENNNPDQIHIDWPSSTASAV